MRTTGEFCNAAVPLEKSSNGNSWGWASTHAPVFLQLLLAPNQPSCWHRTLNLALA